MKVNDSHIPNDYVHRHTKNIKVIAASDVCSNNPNGEHKRGVFYPGINNIGDVIDLNTGKIIGKKSVKHKTKRKR